MDVLWFLRRRLQFIDTFYDQTTAPFQETIRKIESGEPPFVYIAVDPDYVDSDPPFLEELQQASESIEVIGHWSLCMVYASLKAFLEEYLAEMARDYRVFADLPTKLALKKARSWFERYRLLFLEDMGIDWYKAPVKLDDLEHLNLARDDVTHNVDVMSIYAYQTDKHAARYPKGMFIDELWTRLNLGGRIRVGRDELSGALHLVDNFCSWLEGIRNRYPAYVRSLEVADSEPASNTGATS